ncbi:MAG: cyclase family protein [Desulfatiglandales bacterium]
MKVIDLSLPISRDLPLWKVEVSSDFPKHCYRSSTVKMRVHTATHMDSPLHYIEGGKAIDEIPLEMTMGMASLVDLSYKGENEGITPLDLENNGEHIEEGDFVLLRTDWPDKMWGNMEFWRKAPYLTMEGAQWLAEKKPKAVGCDFPQDYVIREMENREPEIDEFVVHHIFLTRGILNIEYLTNLKSIKRKRVKFMAIPLKLKGVEGSPVRALAIED